MLVSHDPLLAEFDRLAQQVFGGTADGVSMPIDVVRRGDDLLVRVDTPGVLPEAIGIDLNDHVLTVSVERHSDYGEDAAVLAQERFDGTMTRRLRIPDWVDSDRVEADYAEGVLTVTLPMAEKARPRKIQIGSGGRTVLTR